MKKYLKSKLIVIFVVVCVLAFLKILAGEYWWKYYYTIKYGKSLFDSRYTLANDMFILDSGADEKEFVIAKVYGIDGSISKIEYGYDVGTKLLLAREDVTEIFSTHSCVVYSLPIKHQAYIAVLYDHVLLLNESGVVFDDVSWMCSAIRP